MKILTKCSRYSLLIGAANLLFYVAGSAQETGIALDETDDQVYVLEEFRVTGRADQFKPEETVGPFRTNTRIIETPFNVTVIQQDLLEAFQLMEPDDQIGLVSGGNPLGEPESGTGGATRLRGYAPTYYRNGFRRLFGGETANLERTEYIKGGIGAMFGQTSPGGMVNYITRRPGTSPRHDFRYTVGDMYQRAQFSTTGPLVDDKLYYRIDSAFTKQGGHREFFKNDLRVLSGALYYRLSPDTSLTMELEQTKRWMTTSSPNSGIANLYPGFVSPVTGQVVPGNTLGGINEELHRRGFNHRGPGTNTDRVSTLGEVRMEHRISDAVKLRANAIVQSRPFRSYHWTNVSYRPLTDVFQGRQPERNETHHDLYQGQVDLLAEFDTGGLKHHALFALDTTYWLHNTFTYRMLAADLNALPATSRNLRTANPDWTYFDRSKVTNPTTTTYVESTLLGLVASDRITVASGRLTVHGSFRLEYMDMSNTNVLNPAGSGSRTLTQPSYSAGGIFKAAGDSLVLFASASTGFNPVTAIDRGTNELRDNETSEGFEFGAKGEILSGGLYWMVSAYRLDRKDIAQRNPLFEAEFDIGSGIPEFLGNGVERVEGVDFEVAGDVTKSLSASATYSIMDARTLRFPDEPEREGVRLIRAPERTGSATARYRFREGIFQGVTVGAAARYTTWQIARYGTGASTITGTGQITADLRLNYGPLNRIEEVRPSVVIYDAFANYTFRGLGKRHTIGVNVRNLADTEWWSAAAGHLMNGREFRFTYGLRF